VDGSEPPSGVRGFDRIPREDEPKQRRAARRVHFQPAAMRARNGLRDEEPETESVAAARVVTPRTKRLEDPRQDVARDRALVLHFDGDVAFVSGHPELDGRPWRAVLDCVRGQVRNRLHDAMFVPRADAIHVAVQRDLAVARDRFEFVDDLTAHRAQVRRFRLDGDAGPFAFPREVQQVADDVLNAVDAALDQFRVPPGAWFGDLLQTARGEQDGAERITDVVADD